MKKQRIVVIDSGEGSSYHRCVLPSKYLQGQIVKIEGNDVELDFVTVLLDIKNKTVKEEMLQNGDVIWFNWLVTNNVTDFGKWKVSKNIKFLYSIDDYWNFPENHPYIERIRNQKNKVLQLAFEADVVVASTKKLGELLTYFNNNISYSPNFLPIGEGQFVSDKKESDKLRIGLLGSSSHVPDYKLLKGAINRIGNNKELCKKIEFHICGYTSILSEIKNMFEKKKNIKLVLHEPVDVNNYMSLYNEIDVILIPLENNVYNECKSAIKLAECLASNTIPIGSELYDGKELTGYCKATTPLEYENWLSYLVNKENYNNTLNTIKEANSKDNDFKGRIESLKSVFETLLNNKFEQFPEDVKIHGITYNDGQITEFENYKNNVKTLAEKSWRFEMNPIIDIVTNSTQENGYLGVVSYKFRKKTGLTKKILNRILLENKYQEYDFINLSRSYWNNGRDFLKFTEECHPGITELMKEVVEKVGLTWDVKTETTNYSNFFILKTELYKDFVNNYCIPALEYMESDDKFMANATYDVGLSKELLKENTELEHYPMIPFIMEKLILFYTKDKQLKVLNLI